MDGEGLFLFRLDGNEIRLPRLSYKLQVAGINDYNGSYREIGPATSEVLPIEFHDSRYLVSLVAILDT